MGQRPSTVGTTASLRSILRSNFWLQIATLALPATKATPWMLCINFLLCLPSLVERLRGGKCCFKCMWVSEFVTGDFCILHVCVSAVVCLVSLVCMYACVSELINNLSLTGLACLGVRFWCVRITGLHCASVAGFVCVEFMCQHFSWACASVTNLKTFLVQLTTEPTASCSG